MTKLTETELEQECKKFKDYLIMPVPMGINEYKKNDFVSGLLKQDVDFITSAFLAWLRQAELNKENKNE